MCSRTIKFNWYEKCHIVLLIITFRKLFGLKGHMTTLLIASIFFVNYERLISISVENVKSQYWINHWPQIVAQNSTQISNMEGRIIYFFSILLKMKCSCYCLWIWSSDSSGGSRIAFRKLVNPQFDNVMFSLSLRISQSSFSHKNVLHHTQRIHAMWTIVTCKATFMNTSLLENFGKFLWKSNFTVIARSGIHQIRPGIIKNKLMCWI